MVSSAGAGLLNTGEVGFEPTTRILEIPILPSKLHS